MKRVFAVSLAVSFVSLGLALPHGACAAWSSDSIAVAEGANEQRRPQVVYDGSGGYYVAWQETSVGGVFAQYYNAQGDATWATALQLSSTADSSPMQEATADGSGGLLVSWKEDDDYTRVQRVDSGGTIAWAAGGVPVLYGGDGWIAADGTGGAIVMSYDEGTVNRVGADGSLPWGDEDSAIAFSTSSSATKIVPDGAGGAILLWTEGSAFSGVAVQRIDSDGNFVWNGGVPVQLSADGASYSCPRLIPQSGGGAIVAWYSSKDIMAQKIDGAGALQWTAGGAVVATSTSYANDVFLASDSSGGAFITWADGGEAVHAQHIDTDGQIVWAAPVAMSTDTTLDSIPQHPAYTVLDGQGGFITTWPTEDEEIKAQRVNAAGDLLWTDTGALLATATDIYYGPKLTTNGQGGAVIVWVDRLVDTTGTDIFMQAVGADGVAGDPGYTPTSTGGGGGSSGGCFLNTL